MQALGQPVRRGVGLVIRAISVVMLLHFPLHQEAKYGTAGSSGQHLHFHLMEALGQMANDLAATASLSREDPRKRHLFCSAKTIFSVFEFRCIKAWPDNMA